MNQTDEFILDALREQGLVTDELIEEVNAAVMRGGKPHGGKSMFFMDEILAKTGLPQEDLVNYLSSELSMEAVDFSQVNPTQEIIGLLTPELARKFEVLPLGVTGAEIELAVGDPLDFLENGQSALEFELKKSINPKVAYRGAVLEAIDQAYGAAEDRKMNDFFEGMSEDEIEIGDGVRPEDVSEEDAPIIKYVHSVIKDALDRRASDIHMEPLEKKFRIRFRVDGKLQEQPDPPKRLQPSIISRTKLMANVSLAEKRVPWTDGST